jgi:hypothetical protein
MAVLQRLFSAELGTTWPSFVTGFGHRLETFPSLPLVDDEVEVPEADNRDLDEYAGHHGLQDGLSTGAWDRATTPSTQQIRPYDGFLCREAQLAQLEAWYTSGIPLAGVIGLTGIGKTWLVYQWLATKQADDPNFVCHVLDAGLSFEETSPEQATNILLQRISDLCDSESPGGDFEPGDVATLARQRKWVIVIDNGEGLLHPAGRRSKVGVPSENLLRFLSAFLGNADGPGRLVFISRLQPQGVVEDDHIQRGHVQVIGGQGSKDPHQMPGFAPEEAKAALDEWLEDGHRLSGLDLQRAVERFEGHPKGLRWFTRLTPETRHQFLQAKGRQGLDAELHWVLSALVETCSQPETHLLRLVAALGRPEAPNVLSNASGTATADTMAALDGLRRRSLVQHDPFESTWSAHGIVAEWNRQMLSNSIAVLHQVHASLLSAYRALDIEEGAAEPETALLAAHHASKADERTQAKQWRNTYTKRVLSQGKELYRAGNIELSLEGLRNLLDELPDLPKTAPEYESGVYYHIAVCQHRLDQDWRQAAASLRQALGRWPDNIRVFNFYPNVLRKAIEANEPWASVDAEFEHVVAQVRTAYTRSGGSAPFATAVMRLLTMWGETDKHRVGEVYHALKTVVPAELPDRFEILEPNWLEEALQACGFLVEHAPHFGRPGEASRYAFLAAEFAGLIDLVHPSLDLLMATANAHTTVADHVGSEAQRLEHLERAYYTLSTLAKATIKRRLARQLSITTLKLCRLKPADVALDLVTKSLELIRSLGDRFILTPFIAAGVHAAEIRLLRGAYSQSSSLDHLRAALRLARQSLEPDRYLTIELADQVLWTFSDAGMAWNNGYEEEAQEADSGEQPAGDELLITRNDLSVMDRRLLELSQLLNAPEFRSLRLRVRTEYLRTHWTSPPQPPRELAQALEIAADLFKELGEDVPTVRTVIDFWQVVATHTAQQEEFENAIAMARVLIDHLKSISTEASGAILRQARLFRSVLDYKSARDALRDYLAQSGSRNTRIAVVDLYLDVVAHDLHWANARDEFLSQDAQQILELYQELLTYRGVAEHQQDLSDGRVARRVLWALRCQAHVGKLDAGNVIAIDTALSRLKFVGNRMENAQVVGDLSDSTFPLAQILGKHWSNPAIWREVGTWVAAIMGSSPAYRQQAALIWSTARNLNERMAHWTTDGRRPRMSPRVGTITQLNLARWLLGHASHSGEWQEGVVLLRELDQSRSMPWLYRRFVLKLLQLTGAQA